MSNQENKEEFLEKAAEKMNSRLESLIRLFGGNPRVSSENYTINTLNGAIGDYFGKNLSEKEMLATTIKRLEKRADHEDIVALLLNDNTIISALNEVDVLLFKIHEMIGVIDSFMPISDKRNVKWLAVQICSGIKRYTYLCYNELSRILTGGAGEQTEKFICDCELAWRVVIDLEERLQKTRKIMTKTFVNLPFF